MLSHSLLQSYVNNVRRHMARRLKPGIGIRCEGWPVAEGGGVVVFYFGWEQPNHDTVHIELMTYVQVFDAIRFKAFNNRPGPISFKGTSIVLEPDRAVVIKDGASSHWDDRSAQIDVERIVTGRRQEP